MRSIPAKEWGREGSLPTPTCNNFSQVLGSLEIYEAFSMSITLKRCCEEKRKAFSCIGFSYSSLSDLMDFKGKLLLGKSRDEKCKMSLLEGSIGLLDSISVQKATEGQLLPRNTQNTGYQVRSQITPKIFEQNSPSSFLAEGETPKTVRLRKWAFYSLYCWSLLGQEKP